eukprot:g11316.t1
MAGDRQEDDEILVPRLGLNPHGSGVAHLHRCPRCGWMKKFLFQEIVECPDCQSRVLQIIFAKETYNT